MDSGIPDSAILDRMTMRFLVAAVALTLLLGCNAKPSGRPFMTPEEQQAAREASERREKEAAEHRKEQEAADAERQQKEAAERREALKAKYAPMTPAQRLSAITRECTEGPCVHETLIAIASAAATDAERLSLVNAITRAENAFAEKKDRNARNDAEKKARDARDAFAVAYDQQLLAKGLNPTSVKAVGADKTTLRLEIGLCSRQFLYEIQRGDIATQLKAVGFKHLECTDGYLVGSADL